MAIDTSIPRSRRALLAGGIGGLAALVASALGRSEDARAGRDGDVVLGGNNWAVSTTWITNFDNDSTVLEVTSAHGGGVAVHGRSGSSSGVWGLSSTSYGVVGGSTQASGLAGWSRGGFTGVVGYSGLDSVPAPPPKTGVYGCALQDDTAVGLRGRSTIGRGVFGQATTGRGVHAYATSGTAVHAVSDHGYALRTHGRIKPEQVSGIATIAAGTAFKDVVLGVDVTSSSFVLLTPRGNLGGRSLWYTVDATNDRFTIRVSTPVTSNLTVGWLLLG